MKNDLYMKTVLTIIALCLTYFVVRDVFVSPVFARGVGHPEVSRATDVNIVGVGGKRVTAGLLPCRAL